MRFPRRPDSPVPAHLRTEALEKLTEICSGDAFKTFEPLVITELLPIVLARLDDKPKVVEAALEAGKVIVTKAAIQGFL